jgi:hypothetical protein
VVIGCCGCSAAGWGIGCGADFGFGWSNSAREGGIVAVEQVFGQPAVRWLCPNQKWQIQELHYADQSIPAVTAAIAGYGS